jgi:pimeloyl-ACP methyl ester carboxylesterase
VKPSLAASIARRLPHRTLALLAALVLVPTTVLAAHGAAGASADTTGAKPRVVLVHGAWADGGGWNGVIKRLQDAGYSVTALANPLRSLTSDAAAISEYLDAVDGPVVLVGHSYGGAVITNAATGHDNVQALVYVDAFAPDLGQTAFELAGPDSALAVEDPTTVFDFVPPDLPPGPDTDLYIKTPTFFSAFATGVHKARVAKLAATQRPVTLGALTEASGEPAWKTIPAWYLLGTKDLIIPPSAQRAMAKHAGAHISTFPEGHLGLISDPDAVARVIKKADAATRPTA